jgi:hypothetical protein
MRGWIARVWPASACALLAGIALAGCASGPAPPAAGRGAVWGYVRLIPRDGVPSRPSGSASYGDRRLADVELVDYTRPGFAVVYAADAPASTGGDAVEIAVRDGNRGPRFEPAHAALSAPGALRVVNRSTGAHVVSCPAAGRVEALAPGASLTVEVARSGEWPVFLLDAPREQARVFAAPGTWTVTSDAGRFELRDLPPGPHRISVWHPRFPPASAPLDVAAGAAARLDLELRVDQREEAAALAY